MASCLLHGSQSATPQPSAECLARDSRIDAFLPLVPWGIRRLEVVLTTHTVEEPVLLAPSFLLERPVLTPGRTAVSDGTC